MYRIKLLFVIMTLLFLPTIVMAETVYTSGSDWVQQDDIRWTISGSNTFGQFVTGEWYVVGNCSVTAITPTPTGTNGTVKNPNTGAIHGFSNKARYDKYDSSLNLGLSLPINLVAGDFLISTTPFTFNSTDQTNIDQMAVLTVVGSAPPTGSFRPGINDSSRYMYNFNDIDWSVFQNYSAPSSMPNTANMADTVSRLWPDFLFGWYARDVRPIHNQEDYGGGTNIDLSNVSLALNTNISQGEKEAIAIGYLQRGIDFASIALIKNGQWKADGGQFAGRKLPIMIVGEVFDSSSIRALWARTGDYGYNNTYGVPPSDYLYFQEDDQTHYVSQQDVDMTNSGDWDPDNQHGPAEKYTSAHIGMPEWGIRYVYNPAFSTDSWWQTAYRQNWNGRVTFGWVVAARAMGFQSIWNHDVIFDYHERYLNISKGYDDGWSVGGEEVAYQPSTFYQDMYNLSWNTSNTCDNDWNLCENQEDCETAGWYYYGGICNRDPEGYPAAVLSEGYPGSSLPVGTDSVTMAIKSSEDAIVKYDLDPDTDYADMTFTMTPDAPGTSHSAELTGLVNGQLVPYYLKSQDTFGFINEDDYVINVNVLSDTSDQCNNSDFWPCTSAGETACINAGFEWYFEACRTIPRVGDSSDLQLQLNGSFDNWTDGTPNGYSLPYTGGGSISNVDNSLSVYASGVGWPPSGVSQYIGEENDGVLRRFYINHDCDSAEIHHTGMENSSGGSLYLDTPGTFTGTFINTDSNLIFLQATRDGTSNTTCLDDFIILEVGGGSGSLPDGGNGKILLNGGGSIENGLTAELLPQ